jgi:polysaccharide biosynthesis transport protein
MNLTDYLNIVLRHKWMLIISTVVCTLIGLAACFVIPKVYESNGKLLISQDNMSLMNNGSPLEDIMLSSLGKSDPLTTQMEILKTRPILNKVIDSLGLVGEDGVLQPEDLLKKFSFSLVRNTNLIEIKCRSANSDTAALFVNTLMQMFVENNQQLNQEMVSTAKDFIQNQLVEQKIKVEEAEQKLVAFKEKSKVMSLEKETDVNITAYSNLNVELIRVMGELDAANSQQASYRKKLDDKNSANDPRYSVWMNSVEQVENVISGLNAKKAALEHQLSLQKGLMKNTPILEAQLVGLLREQQISNEIYISLLSKFEEYKVQEAAKIGSAKIIEPAVPTIKPVLPKKKIIIVLALMLGVFIGLTLIFSIEYFKDLPHSVDEVKKILGDSLLGSIPYQNLTSHPLFVKEIPESIPSESIRLIQTSIKYKLPVATKGSVVLVTSTQPGEGKSTIAANLAYSYSSSKKTLLMNMDFRKPSLKRIFGESLKSEGIVEGIEDISKLLGYVQNYGTLDLLNSGALPPNPLDLVQSKKMDDIMVGLRAQYDLIIIDSAPIAIVAETTELLRFVDTVAMVVDMSSVSLRSLRGIKNIFDNRTLGISLILNKVFKMKNSYYYKKSY